MKVVKYFASWCAPCTAYSPVFEQAQTHLGFQLPKITWENRNVDVVDAAAYGITSIPATVTYTDDDVEIARMIGNLSIEKLADFVMESERTANVMELERKASLLAATTETEPEL